MILNIRHARTLGLLGAHAPEAEVLANIWNDAATDLEGFNEASPRVRDLLTDSMAWRVWRRDGPVTIQRVTTIRNLKRPLQGTLGPLGREIREDVQNFIELIERIDERSTDETPEDWDALGELLTTFQWILCERRPDRAGAPVPAIALYRLPHQAWVTTGADPAAGSQTARDTLGLIHYPDLGKAGRLSQRLVRMSFTFTPEADPLPEIHDRGVLHANPSGAWLVRPTVCHEPTHRFVQGNSHDLPRNPARYGRTINLSTTEYLEGVNELVLVHGDDAKLEWNHLELLSPPVFGRAHDKDHDDFVRTVEPRLP